MRKFSELLQDGGEQPATYRQPETMGQLVEPTEDERRNGWTAETLTAYLAERNSAQERYIDPHDESRRRRPNAANSRYRPHKWRR